MLKQFIVILKRIKYGFLKFKAKKSYAQQGEDLIIKFIFNTLGITKPSYIDIGAHDPFYLSNTAILYSTGSRGINIEPNPNLISKFKVFRKRDTNLNIGISDHEGILDFFIMSEPTMSTFSSSEAYRIDQETRIKIKEIKKVPILSLDKVLEKHFNNNFPDLLSLDVEGIEEIILESIDFTKWAPKVICLETLTYSENGKEIKKHDLINYVLSKGYFVYADTYVNTIFVQNDTWASRFEKKKNP